MKIHLDTDLGGDIDDLCALAMLLKWQEPIEIAGITVVGDDQGKRTGAVRYALKVANREEIPVACGADISEGYYRQHLGVHHDEYWPGGVTPSPNDKDEAIELIKKNIEDGAIVIGIGPTTNLALVEKRYPGTLAKANLYLMGGHLYPIREGYPTWKNDSDFNFQIDTRSSLVVLNNSNPTLIPLSVTVETFLRQKYLPKLNQGDDMAKLIAHQAERFLLDEKFDERFGAMCQQLPKDIINFQHDALACAIALGWREGVEMETLPIVIDEVNGLIRERIDNDGREMRVVTKIDGEKFSRFWLGVVSGHT